MKKMPVAAALCAAAVMAGSWGTHADAKPPSNVGPHGWPTTWPNKTGTLKVGNVTCKAQLWTFDFGSYVLRVVCPPPAKRGVASVWSVADGAKGKPGR